VAVVSQPGKRAAHSPAPGPLDPELKEFWTENPWDITSEGHNLSAYERKRTFMNLAGKGFLDVSFLTGTDNDGDGRSVIACDFRNNGQQDLVVRQVGGGVLLMFENHFPRRHYLEVSLRGKRSNRLGIGARLTARVGGRQIVREVFPADTFASQAPLRAHFGLGDVVNVDKLTIRWPSGVVQQLSDLAGDRHIIVDEEVEGPGAVQTVVPGRPVPP
jgi:hypothetical protein